MKKKILEICLIFIICVACSGAGYVGTLPDLSPPPSAGFQKIENLEKYKEENLAPQQFPEIYSTVILHKKKKNVYQKKINEIIPILEGLDNSIKQEESLQLFSAKAYMYIFKVNKLNADFSGKKESKSDSFKQLCALKEQLKPLVSKWINLEQSKEYKGNYSVNYNNLRIELNIFNKNLKNVKDVTAKDIE